MKNLICIIILAFTFQSFARGKGGDFKILDKLNLSVEQITKIETFKSEHKKKREARKESRKDYREDMKNLFIQGAGDEEMKTLHQSIKSQRSARADMKLDKMIFFKNVLNEEQRKIFIEAKREHRGRSHKKRHENN